MALLGAGGSGENKYWLGAKIGTAIHAELEKEAAQHLHNSRDFPEFENARLEEKIYLGHVPHYGHIYSTPDLYLPSMRALVDYKTTTRAKVKKYDLTGIPEQYLVQGNLYARGLENLGYPVDTISFVFISRDGTQDSDIKAYTSLYDRTVADMAWDRMVNMWEWLRAGGDPDELQSDPGCFVCNVLNKRSAQWQPLADQSEVW